MKKCQDKKLDQLVLFRYYYYIGGGILSLEDMIKIINWFQHHQKGKYWVIVEPA